MWSYIWSYFWVSSSCNYPVLEASYLWAPFSILFHFPVPVGSISILFSDLPSSVKKNNTCSLCSDSFASLEEFSQHKCCQVKTEDSCVEVKSEEDVVKTEPVKEEECIRAYSLQEAEALLKSENSESQSDDDDPTHSAEPSKRIFIAIKHLLIIHYQQQMLLVSSVALIATWDTPKNGCT